MARIWKAGEQEWPLTLKDRGVLFQKKFAKFEHTHCNLHFPCSLGKVYFSKHFNYWDYQKNFCTNLKPTRYSTNQLAESLVARLFPSNHYGWKHDKNIIIVYLTNQIYHSLVVHLLLKKPLIRPWYVKTEDNNCK